MTLPSPLVPTQEPERQDLPFPSGPVEELLRLFTKAIRAHQLYLPNNPIYKGAIDALRGGFGPIWGNIDELVLAITETDLRWYDRPVLEEGARSSDALPWLLYKDGLRELRILPGFESEELVKLLDILQRVRKASPDEDDLLTLLWEGDFTLLRYRYVDLAMEPAAPLDDTVTSELPKNQQQVAAAIEEVKESRAGVVDLSDFDATLYFLDEREIDYLREEVRREYAADLRANVLSILLDIFEQQSAPAVREEVGDLLDNFLLHLLSAGKFRTVAFLLREAAVAAQRAQDLEPAHRSRLLEFPDRLSAPEALGQLLQALDEAGELPPQDELVELFEQLRPAALGTALAWLGRLENQRVRALLATAAERLAMGNTGELVRLIISPDPSVAAEAMRRSGALKTAAAVGPLGKVLAEATPDLRLLAVQALAEIGSAGALQTLERALEDPDRDVRVATSRALSSRGYRAALPRVEAMVKGKVVRDADLTEKMAIFELYGALCGEAGIPHLDGLLNGKGFLGRREDAELRACAAMALGRVGSERAFEALRRASSEKDVVVRNAVNRALRGGAP